MSKQENTINCPLCGGTKTKPFYHDRRREFFQCLECDLVFVPPEFHLSAAAEKKRYDHHNHSVDDSGYRTFLTRLFQPLENKLPTGACGLDFGCGQTPTLSVLFEEAEFPCRNYDLYYANDPSVLETQYDFLTCSETMEHMLHPGEEFTRFVQLIRPGGWIGLMTQLRDEAAVPFEQWFYKDDKTHICFFSKQSFQWLETSHALHIEFHSDSVILFQKLRCGTALGGAET